MKIIGHRGAAGLALENTIESIKAAVSVGVDGIEFDVRLTKDGVFVLSHDVDLQRVSNSETVIADIGYKDIRKIKLSNGETIASLTEALRAVGSTPVYVEAKGNGWAEKLADYMQHCNSTSNITVIAINHQELAKFHELTPEVSIYVVQRFNPIDVFQALRDARTIGCKGVDLNFWLLNPYTYWLARRYKLDIVVYTVNSNLIARYLHKLFPGISITTNHPHKLSFLRDTNPAKKTL